MTEGITGAGKDYLMLSNLQNSQISLPKTLLLIEYIAYISSLFKVDSCLSLRCLCNFSHFMLLVL